MLTYSRASARTVAKALVALGLALAVGATVSDAEDPVVTKKLQRVEEDWVLLVRNPDGKIASPQVLITLSPDGKYTGEYALLELNHASNAGRGWLPGGVQLQAWSGETNVGIFNSPKTQTLERGYDRISFTTVMEAKGDGFTKFAIKDGRSRTWGRFGDDPQKEIKVLIPSQRTDLSDYSRDHSVSQTHVTHGAHRVTNMYQRRVRYYFDDGTQTVDGEYKVLHRFQHLVQDMTLQEWESTKTEYNYDVGSE